MRKDRMETWQRNAWEAVVVARQMLTQHVMQIGEGQPPPTPVAVERHELLVCVVDAARARTGWREPVVMLNDPHYPRTFLTRSDLHQILVLMDELECGR